jgi:GNAT superfamily N-acetyltransferase
MSSPFSTTSILPGYEISTDPRCLDVDLIHQFLNTSYWAEGRPRETVERSIRHSLCFGVYVADPSAGATRQVAFARVITDCAVFGYLADVFVIPAYCGRGIAKGLMRAILAHPDVENLKVLLLRTRDAHGLYEQFGFGPLPRAEEMMVRYATENAETAGH